ncbi:unnamed protein product [Ceutorhynchus assimilis]|uniref:Uncharacterized protein n=1 Tax=Ceutorhynchus assimilis TaxID=467358 RepID=A0A9P0DDJ9_9CUCU|nr:unnamed protein product [Ceutorhynchus assimilis]
MIIDIAHCVAWSVILTQYLSHGYGENSKFLGNDLTDEERHLGKRKRPGYQGGNQGSSPCNFGGRPKNEGSGRTFFDFQYFNVEYNNQLNIDCGQQGSYHPQYPVQPAPVHEIHQHHGGAQAGHKPPHGGGGHRPLPKPPKPGSGSGQFSGNGNGLFGGFFNGGNNKPNKPNRPFQGGAFSQAASEAGEGGNTGPFAGIFPSPQQFALGLSDGLQSFIGTIPAIGQSFQSILPSFSDFQWPQLPQFNPGGSSSSVNNFNRPPPIFNPATTPPSVGVATTAPFTTTTIDPDDIIYSDEIKPVNEELDPITDPYTNKGNRRRYNQRGRSFYQNNQPHYNSRSRQETYRNSPSDSYREQGRSFSFPS